MATKTMTRPKVKSGKSKPRGASTIGGVRSERPFRIRRLQHFALEVINMKVILPH